MRMTIFGAVFGIFLAGTSYAGPYFNSPEGGPEEEMAEYESLLNQARKFIIDMLDNWERNPEAARQSQSSAVDTLGQAEEILFSVQEAEDSNLMVSADFLTSDTQFAAYAQAEGVFSLLDLGTLETYGDLLRSTADLHQRFRDTISEVEIIPFPEGWEQARKVIEADATMVLVGSTFSALAQSAQPPQ